MDRYVSVTSSNGNGPPICSWRNVLIWKKIKTYSFGHPTNNNKIKIHTYAGVDTGLQDLSQTRDLLDLFALFILLVLLFSSAYVYLTLGAENTGECKQRVGERKKERKAQVRKV